MDKSSELGDLAQFLRYTSRLMSTVLVLYKLVLSKTSSTCLDVLKHIYLQLGLIVMFKKHPRLTVDFPGVNKYVLTII